MASLVQVLGALTRGSLTARAYVDNLIGRIQARDPQLKAFVALDEGRAQALADALDALHRRGETIGPLHGLPVGVKDIFDTSDLPTEYGSPAYAGHRPIADAAIVARLHAAGGFVIGKTATTEFAFRHPAETRNPWHPQHTPGGSSSGSAAAVGAGILHAAIGTQTNGSVIRPAAFCGVVGYKPSQGMLPFSGGLYFSPTLDQPGVFTRTVADAACLAAPLADGDFIPAQVSLPRNAPRIGVITNYPWSELEADARAHLDQTVRRLTAAGARTQALQFAPGFADAHRVHRTIMMHEGARQHGERQRLHRARFSAALNEGLDEGRLVSCASYGEMLARRAALIDAAAAAIAPFDIVISPPAPGAAPRRLDTTGDAGFCTLWSLVGFPALTVPSGIAPTGVPYGLQITARPGHDAPLLGCAQWVERALGPLACPRIEGK